MPWKIEESNEPSGLDGVWLSGLAGLKELFLGFKDELTEEEWADILLIVAAPDLFAACDAALAFFDSDYYDEVSDRSYATRDDVVGGLRKAIEKTKK